MAARTIEEIQPIPNFLHRYRILLGPMLQDQLLQVKEGSLVRHLLPNLYQRLPGVLGCQFSAVRALSMLYKILDLEDLFKDCRSQNFFLNCEGCAKTFGMWLGPYEVSLCEANLI